MEFASAKSAARTEKNLSRGEEWGLKALDIPSDSTNALVPYFLATEIYKPQERWEEMAEMLDEAIKRNPKQKLEKPKFLVPLEEITKENSDKMIIETIGEGVNVYREDAWGMIFNQALELMENDDPTALKKLNLCIKMDPIRIETYTALVQYNVGKGNLKSAREYIEKGLNIKKSSILYEMNAKLLLSEFQNNGDKNSLKEAEKMYLKAMDLVVEDTEILLKLKKQLIFVYIDMNKNQQAIDISNELLNIYYDDPDLYFNIGVLYQRLATNLYDEATKLYSALNNGDTTIEIELMYQNFLNAMNYAQQSKEKFLEANDLETEDTGSREAAAEMRKLVKQIKEIYIPSVKEMGKLQGLNLN